MFTLHSYSWWSINAIFRAEGTGKAGRSLSPIDPTPHQQPQQYVQHKISPQSQKSPTPFSPPTPSPPYQ